MSYWKNYWNNIAENKSPLKQVQRDVISKTQFVLIEKHICDLLKINSNDELLDVCCGNGMITKKIAKHCKHTVGIDFSAKLIQDAQVNNECKKLKFKEENAVLLSDSLHQKFDKILLYFSFQYFNYCEGLQVVAELKKHLKPGGIILIGDIPDHKKLWSYYDSFLKRVFFVKQWICKQPKMGKFWSEKELMALASNNELKGVFLEQPSSLPHSHYRIDFILTHR